MATAPKTTESKDKKAVDSSEAPAKRKMLSAEERVAKLEADLEAAKQRAKAKADKRANELKAKIAALTERRDRVNGQIAELEAELKDEQGDEGDSSEDSEV